MPSKRLHVYYSGMVQGVGFRFTAERVAQRLGVNGWVKNIPDGRVELMAEGGEEALKGLLREIRNGVLRTYISDTEVDWSEASGEFDAFEIKFW